MGNKKLEDTLKSFYGYRLQQDDSRTARLYLNNGTEPILIAKGYSSPSSVSVNHSYNGGVGTPRDLAHHTYEFLKGASLWMQGKYAEAQNILSNLKVIKELLFPQNTAVKEGIDWTTDMVDSIYRKAEPFIKIYESRTAVYDESRGYSDTDFSMQTNLTVVLYPKLITEEDLAISVKEDEGTNKVTRIKLREGCNDVINKCMISPASQLKNLLSFLTGRTEYFALDLKSNEKDALNASTASSNGVAVYTPNPVTLGETGILAVTDADLVNAKSTDFVRYRRITSPNDYSPIATTYKYGIKGTFRLLVGGLSAGINNQKDLNGTEFSNMYGASTRSSTGSNFYDNLLLTNLNITNSDTVMEMKSWDLNVGSYINEVTPEYITLNFGFEHVYKKYDFNELYWALGLSSLEDMKVTSDKIQAREKSIGSATESASQQAAYQGRGAPQDNKPRRSPSS